MAYMDCQIMSCGISIRMKNLATPKQAKEMRSEKKDHKTKESDWRDRCEMHIMEFLGVKISYRHSTIDGWKECCACELSVWGHSHTVHCWGWESQPWEHSISLFSVDIIHYTMFSLRVTQTTNLNVGNLT